MVPIFSKIANHKTGLCYLTSFAENLGLVESESINRLFNMFDNVSYFKD